MRNAPKTCHQCDAPFSLFRKARVTPEEGLCREHGWMPTEPKLKVGRRGFLLMGLGAVAAAVMPAAAPEKTFSLIMQVELLPRAEGAANWGSWKTISGDQLKRVMSEFNLGNAYGRTTVWAK